MRISPEAADTIAEGTDPLSASAIATTEVHSSATAICRNCGEPTDGRLYCGECGQGRRDIDRSSWSLLVEGVVELFSLEGRVLRTLHLLILRPGAVTADYLAGRRRHYTTPVRLYLAASAAFFAGFLLTRPITANYYGFPNADETGYVNRVGRLLILLLLLGGLLLKGLYLRSRRPLVHHLVFSLHAGAAALLWFLTLMLAAAGLRAWFGHYSAAPEWLPEFHFLIHLPGLVLFLGYIVLALHRAYGSTIAGSAARALVIAVVLLAAFVLMIAPGLVLNLVS